MEFSGDVTQATRPRELGHKTTVDDSRCERQIKAQNVNLRPPITPGDLRIVFP